MVFSTLTFLFLFFPLVFILYYLSPNRVYRNTVLLIFSLIFYGWGEPKFILLMLTASLVAYIGGLCMQKFEETNRLKAKKITFIITSVLLISNLFIFKYLNFFVANINLLFPKTELVTNLVLPIGISFYTFQILSYVIDLYRKKIGVQRNYFYLTLYLAFFPQLIAGPIVRYETIEDEIRTRKESLDDIVCGMRRFIVGMAKKVIIANNTGAIATAIYSGDKEIYGMPFYWIAAVAYALQIYFDFSGYSDMAIGLGRMFGFHFLENFDYPYIATSITNFWRRWHISLSSWFRDYVYIPLGGNRVPKYRWIFNICVVWALTGFWHGASWNFVLWGVYFAALLLIEKFLLHKILEKLPKFICWLYTFILVLISWVIFNLTDFSQMLSVLRHMFSLRFTDPINAVLTDTSILYGLFYIPLGIICMFPWAKKFKPKKTAVNEFILNSVSIVLFAISVCFTIASTYNPFIYFRF
ncbi:MAG: MBOAT family protein [Clostridia bacterium]|nr:MBOAT family protein [Clostridia bacterium]